MVGMGGTATPDDCHSDRDFGLISGVRKTPLKRDLARVVEHTAASVFISRVETEPEGPRGMGGTYDTGVGFKHLSWPRGQGQVVRAANPKPVIQENGGIEIGTKSHMTMSVHERWIEGFGIEDGRRN